MEPIERKHRAKMQAVAEVLGETFPGQGFTLLVFDFDPTGPVAKRSGQPRMNYISNASREDMVTAMREFIALLEGNRVRGPGRSQ